MAEALYGACRTIEELDEFLGTGYAIHAGVVPASPATATMASPNPQTTAVTSVVEGDRVAIHWIFELTDETGKVHRVDEVALQEWRGDRIFRERFFYQPAKPAS